MKIVRVYFLWTAVFFLSAISQSYALLPQLIEKSVSAGGSVVLFAINAYQADRGCTPLSQGAVDTVPKLKFGTISSEVVTRVQDGPCGKIPYNIQIVRYQAGSIAGADNFELFYFYTYQSGGQERIKVNVNVVQKGTPPKTSAVETPQINKTKVPPTIPLVSHIENLQAKTIFKIEHTDLIKNKKTILEQVVLEKNVREIKIRTDVGNSQFLNVYDTQLRALKSSNTTYELGGCTGVPSKLAVGVNETHNASFSIFNSETKKTFQQTAVCNSSVVAASQQSIDGVSYAFFEIKNVSTWKLPNGDRISYGISGKFSPTLGYWVERRAIETRNDTVFRDFSFKLVSVQHANPTAHQATIPAREDSKKPIAAEDTQGSFIGVFVNNYGNQVQIEKDLLYYTGMWSGQNVSKKPFVTVQNSGGKLIWWLYECEGDSTSFVCTQKNTKEQRVYRRLN